MRRRDFRKVTAVSAGAGSLRLTALILALAAWSYFISAALAAEPKRVMLLHSFGADFKPWSEYGKEIRSELERQSPWPLDITEQSLVGARFNDVNPDAPFAEYLRALFAKHPPDLIVSIGAPAAAFVQRYRQYIFPNAQCCSRRWSSALRYELTGNDAVVAVGMICHGDHREYPAGAARHQKRDGGKRHVSAQKFWREEISRVRRSMGASRLHGPAIYRLTTSQARGCALPPPAAIFGAHDSGRRRRRARATRADKTHAVANANFLFSMTRFWT